MPQPRHRAQANAMLATIFLAVFTLAIVPLAIYMVQLSQKPPSEKPLTPLIQGSRVIRGEIQGVYNENTGVLLVLNSAGEGVHVDRVVIQIACDNTTLIASVDRANLASSEIPPGGSLLINISQYMLGTCANLEVKTIQVVTRVGAVIPARVVSLKELLSQPGTPHDQISTPITKPVAILPIPVAPDQDLSNFTSVILRGAFGIVLDPSKGMTGGWNGTPYVWRLDRVYQNVTLRIDDQLVRNVWVGYDPRNTSRYNILITADNIAITTPSYSTSSHVRIKIYGFTPRTSYIMRLGTRYVTNPPESIAGMYYTFNWYVDIFLSGVAERVEIYLRTRYDQAGINATGYEPYVLFMNNKPTQGSVGLLFTTIDRLFGWRDTVNEYYDKTDYTSYGALRDYSLTPLILVYTGYEIRNNELLGVILALNYQFIDNEGSDQDGVTSDKPIMILGLMELEEESGTYKIYTYRTYNFWELTRYEDTYPPASQMQSSIVFFPLPDPSSGTRRFYVFLLIQDPYWYNGTLDDLDFALYIESLILIPLRR